MDEEPTQSVDSDQPRYQLRNRTTAVSSSSSQLMITSHANLTAIDRCMAEGRLSGEAAEASLVDPPLREMSQVCPILEVEQESQDTSSTEIYTPPLLQPDTINPHFRIPTKPTLSYKYINCILTVTEDENTFTNTFNIYLLCVLHSHLHAQ